MGSEPLDDRFAQAVREHVVEIEMELGNDPQMGAGFRLPGTSISSPTA